uniref:Aquaporin-4 n=1 Tax=Cacopsylla melanoneura TaxID=428564 RepID=A0A8D9B7Z0_9HEMI
MSKSLSSPHNSMANIKTRISCKTSRLIEIALGELVGSAMLMFFGCMSLVQGFSSTPLPSMQPGLIFGFVVSTVICVFGHISGAHLNPTVSISAYLFESICSIELVVYILSQVFGCLVGVGLLNIITPDVIMYPAVHGPVNGFCTTVPHPSLSTVQAFLAEFFATSLLIFTCCGIWDSRNARFGDSNAIKFALVVALLSITVGPYTGCSMNPARSLAPAFYSNQWTQHWLYWVSPILASVVTSLVYKFVFSKEHQWKNRSEQLGPADAESSVPIN